MFSRKKRLSQKARGGSAPTFNSRNQSDVHSSIKSAGRQGIGLVGSQAPTRFTTKTSGSPKRANPENGKHKNGSEPAIVREPDETACLAAPKNEKSGRTSPSNRADSIPPRQKRPAVTEEALAELEIDFADLPDGTLAEVVEDPGDPKRTLLAIFKKGRVRLTDRLVHAGRVMVPIPRTAPGFFDVKLPRGIKPYRSVLRLYYKVLKLIVLVIDTPPVHRFVIAAYVLYTWVADRLPTAVYFSVIGLPQSGKSTLLELLNLLCRRPLLVSDISEAALSEACSCFGPTLLIDEVDWHSAGTKSTLRQLFRAGTSRSARILRVGKSTWSFGPKVFGSLEPPSDPALNSRCVQIPMVETNKHGLLKPSDPRIMKLAEEIQQQLLQFRLNHYCRIRPAVIPGAEDLRPRSRDLLACLAVPLARDGLLCRILLGFFKCWHDASTEQSLGSRQQALLTAVFITTHQNPPLRNVRIGGEAGLAHLANTLLQNAGERQTLTDKAAGTLLEVMGFYNKQRTKGGWILWLDSSASDRCHHLVKTYGSGYLSEADFKKFAEGCAVCQNQKH